MKLFKKITLTVGCLLLLSVMSLPASAGSFSLGYSSGGHSNHHYSSRNHHSYDHHNSYGYQQHNYSYYQQKRHSRTSYYGHLSYKKPCHQVYKTSVDHYGEYNKVGGTMCYDRYGQGYIVSGSRYHIR